MNRNPPKGQAEEFPPPFHEIPPPPPMAENDIATLFDTRHAIKLSIVLPTLNDSVLLERTVKQFQATMPTPSEIIVVDNGSTDGSSDFLKGDELGAVTLIRTPEPLGVAGARNRGFAHATGQVVVFADAHTDVPERWWQPIVATLKRPNVGIVGPAIGVMGKPDHPPACGQTIISRSLALRWMRCEKSEPFTVPTLGGGLMAIRRSTLERAGTFDDAMPQWGSEDLEICLRYWLMGFEIWVVPEVVVRHYFRDDNPYQVDIISVTHNLLRVAVLHLDGDRLAGAIRALAYRRDFPKAMAKILMSDACERRAQLVSRRTRDADWLFDRFPDCFPT